MVPGRDRRVNWGKNARDCKLGPVFVSLGKALIMLIHISVLLRNCDFGDSLRQIFLSGADLIVRSNFQGRCFGCTRLNF